MGTSSSSKGPGSGTPLVPTWLDDSSGAALPGGAGDSSPETPNETQPDPGSSPVAPATLPPISKPPSESRFQSGRRSFSAFAASGGSDRRAMHRAVRSYVRAGTGGSANAVRKMGASRATARRMLGVFRGFERDGVDTTLRRLNLASLVGRPLEDVLLGLADIVCPDGGSIDEGIARDAWLETIAELEALDIGDAATLTDVQMRETFLAFVTHAIEGRLFQDIGVNGLKVAKDLAAIEAFQAQLRSYIRGAVRDSFSRDLNSLAALSDEQISEIVDQTYRDAWDILDAWSEDEE